MDLQFCVELRTLAFEGLCEANFKSSGTDGQFVESSAIYILERKVNRFSPALCLLGHIFPHYGKSQVLFPQTFESGHDLKLNKLI